jgi:hypothetical protein
MNTTTLFDVQSAILAVAETEGGNAQRMADTIALAVDTLVAYIPVDALDPRATPEFTNAAEAVKVALREVYLKYPRYTGKGATRRPVNMELAKHVAGLSDADREKLDKDSEGRKAWDSMLAYCRKNWQRIADEAFPKPDTATESDAAGKTGKKAPSPDAILANIDAFMNASPAPAPALVATLFDQIRARMIG